MPGATRVPGPKRADALPQDLVKPWTLQWRHNERDDVSNHQPGDCFLNRLFRRRSKKILDYIKAPRHWSLWGNSPVTGEFPTQRASNAEKVSIWWRHHEQRDSGLDFFNRSEILQAYRQCWLSAAVMPVKFYSDYSIQSRDFVAGDLPVTPRAHNDVLTSRWRYFCVVCPLGDVLPLTILALCWENCIGFPLSIGSVTKFCSSPTRHWMAMLHNISQH